MSGLLCFITVETPTYIFLTLETLLKKRYVLHLGVLLTLTGVCKKWLTRWGKTFSILWPYKRAVYQGICNKPRATSLQFYAIQSGYYNEGHHKSQVLQQATIIPSSPSLPPIKKNHTHTLSLSSPHSFKNTHTHSHQPLFLMRCPKGKQRANL